MNIVLARHPPPPTGFAACVAYYATVLLPLLEDWRNFRCYVNE